MTLPVNDMLLFVDVVENMSFSITAKRHHMTPAAISKRISSLEENFGVQLLIRSTRKLILTEAGEQLLKDCCLINQQLKESYFKIRDVNQADTGNIIISCPTNFANIMLAPIIVEFEKKYKNIKIHLLLDDTRGEPPTLGTYDLAIRSGIIKDLNIISRRITTVKFVACATAIYLKEHSKPKIPRDLEKHNCIDYDYREGGQIWRFYKTEKTYKIAIKGNILTNSALFSKNICLQNGGIVMLPEFMVKREILNGQLVQILESYQTDTMPVTILHPYRREYLPKRVRLFIDFLIEKID